MATWLVSWDLMNNGSVMGWQWVGTVVLAAPVVRHQGHRLIDVEATPLARLPVLGTTWALWLRW